MRCGARCGSVVAVVIGGSSAAAYFFQGGNFGVCSARPVKPSSHGTMRKVVIVGGGIAGTSTAYTLLQRGYRVKLIEAGPADGMQSASSGNAGTLGISSAGHSLASWKNVSDGVCHAALAMIKSFTIPEDGAKRRGADDGHRKSFFVDKSVLLDTNFLLWGFCWLKLLVFNKDMSHEGWKERNITAQEHAFAMAEHAGCTKDVHMAKSGRLSAQMQAEFGGNFLSDADASELLPVQECTKLFPILDGARIAGAKYKPEDGYGECGAFCREVLKVCGKHENCEIVFNSRVTRVLLGRGGETTGVEDEHGHVHEADAVVVCGGVASRELLKTAGVFLPIIGLRGYSVTVPLLPTARDKLPRSPPPHCIVSPFSLYISQFGSRVRFTSYGVSPRAGSCARALIFTGKFQSSGDGSVGREGAGELTAQAEGSAELHARLERMVRFVFPGSEARLDWARAVRWHGDRPVTPDCQAVVGLSRRPGLLVNAGHSFNGWREAPLTAALVADVLAAGDNAALGSYRPLLGVERFQLWGSACVPVSEAAAAAS